MKLSIVIICWNDLKVIKDCLASVYRETSAFAFEVIVSDNGSGDGSVEYIRAHFPHVRIVENGANLGFARGNNAGIAAARGEYVLILNPDTIILNRALEKLVAYAEARPDGGAFGCRVLNPDGSFQHPARPLPTPFGGLIAALNVRWLGKVSSAFESDLYYDWEGTTERAIGFQSGCCVMVRRELLERLHGFDERFFYHFEETDLCSRIWKAGSKVMFFPGAEITHLGGQSVGRFPIRFALETYRSRYRYFYKHFGTSGLKQMRWVSLLDLGIRYLAYGVWQQVRPHDALENRLKMYAVAMAWNWRVDPVQFIGIGDEPDLGYAPLAPAPRMVD
jgi:N-acetylglucosaminyl-diphospho-decaprenol L-rhamnosyltransferase